MITTRVLAGLVLAATTSTAAMAADLTPVKFGTNWLPQAEHGGYYQAVAKGYYNDCGIDVEIVPGGPQVNNRAMLMAGKIDFNMAGNLLLPFNSIDQGIPVKVVAAHFQKEPQVLMTHPGKFSSFEDLKNVSKMILGDAGFQSYYQWMITTFGFDAGKRVPYTFNPAPFIADEMSAQQGYITSEPFAVEREGGFKPDIWVLGDDGFSTYATLVETMDSTIEETPEVVQCFVDASSIGWADYLYGDPAPANEMIQAANADMSDEQIAFSISQLKEYGIVDSGYSLEHGIGAMDPEVIEEFYEKMVTAGVVPEGLDVSTAFTTEFSNTGVALEKKKELLGE
nr:ABC transporter substrate-binding protein [uncultured Celeribacter sp.]